MKLFLLLLINLSVIASIGNVLFVKGEATILRKNKEVKITKKSTIQLKDIITTSDSSLLVLKLVDGTTIKLERNSQLVVEDILTGSNQTRLKLSKGSSFFNYIGSVIKDSTVPPLQIETKTASLGVRGTTFYVLITQDKNKKEDTWMCVSKGQVSARNSKSGDEKIVNTGQGVRISSSVPMQKPRFLPWTKALNWNLDQLEENLETNMETENVYQDILTFDYD